MSNPNKRLHHPYHLKRLYSVWRWRLLKHVHTGRRVHHQHTSYPVLGLLLLVVGILIGGSTLTTYASTPISYDLSVSAIVPGEVPTVAATIDTPVEGTDFQSTPINVTGTCPVKTYVQLFRNDYPSGTALCSASGTYGIETDLFEGTNKLIVRDYNYGGQAGPDSTMRTVTYTKPVAVVTPPITGSQGNSSGNTNTGSSGAGASGGQMVQPLTLRSDYVFRGYAVGTPASWDVAVLGGVAPYSISVNWGDGSSDLYTAKTADSLTLTHSFTAPGPYDGSYRIIVTASDADGNHTTLQILALVTPLATSAASTGGGTTNGSPFTIFGIGVWQLITSVWMTYGAVCLVLLAFWLGEARELRLIRAKFRLQRL